MLEDIVEPVYSLGIERDVLSAMISDKTCLRATTRIKADYFFSPSHKTVFQVLHQLNLLKIEVDFSVLCHEVSKVDPDLHVTFLSELAMSVTSIMSFEYKLNELVEYYKKRQFQTLAMAILRDVLCEKKSLEISSYIQNQMPLITSAGDEAAIQFLGDIVANFTKDMDNALNNPDQSQGIPSGLKPFDKLYKGFKPGRLYVLGARPGVGKTIALVHFACKALETGVKGGFISLEMSNQEVFNRMISHWTKVNSRKTLSGTMNAEDIISMRKALDDVLSVQLFFASKRKMNVYEICDLAHKMKDKHGIEVLYLDYIQLVSNLNKFGKRHEEIGDITRNLKLLSQELNIPVIAAAQLNRTSEEEKEPELHHLKDSGSIEQDADMAILMHTMNRQAGEDKYKILMKVPKTRHEPFTSFECFINGSTSEIVANEMSY